MKLEVAVFYPGYTTKAVSFTIDDGNIAMDEKFLSIVKPAGIKGTFNLCSNGLSQREASFFTKMYEGYEIANHCKYHPYAFDDAVKYEIRPCEERAEATPDPTVLYEVDGRHGYYDFLTERGWRSIADDECYVNYADVSREELEAVFGEGSIVSYVWPYCEQNNAAVKAHLRAAGYKNIRKTGCTTDTTAFAVPKDLMAWSYNADNRCLLDVMDKYEKYPCDGELKAFIFGVHSWDFERDSNWCDLETFAEKYGNRQEDYWYATVGEIFAYADATASLTVVDNLVINPSEITLYITANGKKYTVAPRSRITVD